MTDQDTVVRRQVVVPVNPDRAFSTFVDRIGDIKPREHNILGAPIAETVMEPRVGGGVVDRDTDGSECRWARVLVYDPPNRLVLSWDINPRWQVESDLDHTSEVELRFLPDGADRTRVELEHRNLDRHGTGWESVRDGVADDAGWTLYLDRFLTLTEAAA